MKILGTRNDKRLFWGILISVFALPIIGEISGINPDPHKPPAYHMVTPNQSSQSSQGSYQPERKVRYDMVRDKMMMTSDTVGLIWYRPDHTFLTPEQYEEKIREYQEKKANIERRLPSYYSEDRAKYEESYYDEYEQTIPR